ncbi:division plane positioning ATPase MipZ [Polymorphobacter sp. PAMC 29334]|uniref:division plane positioning ATPase MipZ n=1 Tax=Polymorphobacter sp. PAMC 29334 TaxID=2862331 RepID=UPI001C686F06|nr:division plane positioning ATPase MipZ [Polymorphobacter sp. PAMC 29334]QYE34664.1 division plane positioning ATPase MipZ [Polymorphobacter sp. PAMC 29334]
MRAQQAHLIVLGNEKGGSGKSTTAVHIAVALAHDGHRVGVVDLDSRQRTVARYLENRAAFAKKRELALVQPEIAVIADGDGDVAALGERLDAWSGLDYVVVDTPGRDSAMGRAALARADTLVTPMNDSFVDFDLIGQVDPETFKVRKLSFYSEMVWDARKARGRVDGGTVDWVVLRNRLSSLEARNMKRVGGALDELAKRVGFRVVPGLSERVIFRELFPRGLTLLDVDALEDFSLSHVAARAELRALVAGLNLPAKALGAADSAGDAGAAEASAAA